MYPERACKKQGRASVKLLLSHETVTHELPDVPEAGRGQKGTVTTAMSTSNKVIRCGAVNEQMALLDNLAVDHSSPSATDIELCGY